MTAREWRDHKAGRTRYSAQFIAAAIATGALLAFLLWAVMLVADAAGGAL